MTTISAKVIADSVGSAGQPRLTTILCRYPRWIHAEQRTHRVMRDEEEFDWPTPSLMADPNLSRNASSSRAIPVNRLIQQVEADPAEPIYWGKNQPGMQAREEFTGRDLELAQAIWRAAMKDAIAHARQLAEVGAHKQIVNRILEPYSHITVLVTATEWENFFALRDHEDAEPHMRDLARAMRSAMYLSEPKVLRATEWHLPFVTEADYPAIEAYLARVRAPLRGWPLRAVTEVAIKLSVARCARTSYDNHDGTKPEVEADVALHDRLVVAKPAHASPAEHQATPDTYEWAKHGTERKWANPHLHANLKGWRQYRRVAGFG
jgi:thymidylate synthase ThyX